MKTQPQPQQSRRQTPKRSKTAGDRRPNALGKYKDQRKGTEAFRTWVTEARKSPSAKYHRKG